MQPYERRGASEGGDIANGEYRPTIFDLELGVLSRIFSNNRARDYSVSDR